MASEAPGCGWHVGLTGDSWTELECPQPWRNFSLAKSVTGLLLRAFQMAEPHRGVVCNPRLALNLTVSANPEHFWPPVSCPGGGPCGARGLAEISSRQWIPSLEDNGDQAPLTLETSLSGSLLGPILEKLYFSVFVSLSSPPLVMRGFHI